MEIAIVLGMAVVFTALMATFQTVYWTYSARQERESLELQPTKEKRARRASAARAATCTS